MGASQSIINWNPLAAVCSERRRLVYRLAMSVLVVAASSVILRAQENRKIPRIYMPPDTPADWSIVLPTPQYVPGGYELFRVFREPIGGFSTGSAEIEFDYIDKSCWARGKICPLEVFVSPMTTNPFGGTIGRKSELLSLWIGHRTVEAQYFIGNGDLPSGGDKVLPDGQQSEPDANDFNANLNSLVFPFDGFMIGIRGSKLGGVDRAELIKVAKSLTFTVR